VDEHEASPDRRSAGPEKATRIRELERRIAELRARLPKHSAPPGMLIELDELEDALQALRAEQ